MGCDRARLGGLEYERGRAVAAVGLAQAGGVAGEPAPAAGADPGVRGAVAGAVADGSGLEDRDQQPHGQDADVGGYSWLVG